MASVTTDSGMPLSASQSQAVADRAEAHGWRLVVLFGSMAEQGQGRDVDIAVLPENPPDAFAEGRWVAELERIFHPHSVDLVVLTPRTSPLTRFEVFRAGIPLYEAEEGQFDHERDRAFFLYADSAKFRQAMREALHGGA